MHFEDNNTTMVALHLLDELFSGQCPIGHHLGINLTLACVMNIGHLLQLVLCHNVFFLVKIVSASNRNLHSIVLNRHSKVLNAHSEVLNGHSKVMNGTFSQTKVHFFLITAKTFSKINTKLILDKRLGTPYEHESSSYCCTQKSRIFAASFRKQEARRKKI